MNNKMIFTIEINSPYTYDQHDIYKAISKAMPGEDILVRQEAAQQSAQQTTDPSCKHENHETVWHCLDCGEYI